MDKKVEGNCLFDVFPFITALDLSSIQFEPKSNNTETHLTRLLQCKQQNGQKLLDLYLRNLKLQRLLPWLTNDSFPLLRRLDLSNNNIASIDISTFTNLLHISLAYNPIGLKNIIWRAETIYASINLRSTIRSSTVSLSRRLKTLLKLSLDIDYSENEGEIPANITNIPVAIDFPTGQFALKISRSNIYSFEINFDDLRRLDISSNSLTELDLNDEIKLNYLDCSNQSLKKLILSEQLSQLNELKCSNNSLTTIINFASLKHEQLKSIDLSYNLIKSLEDLFLNLQSRNLRRINLKSNLIESIPSNIFHEKLISLYEINLSWNRIDKIENFAFQAPNLQILDLTGNSLKIVEPKAIFTASLRLFFVFNDTQQLTNRCARSKSNDNLISMYANWFQTNGTLMKDNKIQLNKCINRYVNQTKKLDVIIKKGKHFFGFYSLYITLAASLIGILFVGTYFYRQNKFTFLSPFGRYKKLDRHSLVENAAEMDQQQREDDEIVMNLESPPFNKLSLGPTNV
jgi:Leucine-rich repeat (LRR) protein